MRKYKTVPEFLDDLEPPKRLQVEILRDVILNLGFELSESIKWNAPNYKYKEVDRISFNLMNKEGKVKVVIHMGATKKEDKKRPPVLKDDSGIINWNSDIRGTTSFDIDENIDNKREKFITILTHWLNIEV